MSGWDWFVVWMLKPLAEAALYVGVWLIALIFLAFFYFIPMWVGQIRCRHDRIRETQSCHAICRRCGKDLGFIGQFTPAERARRER